MPITTEACELLVLTSMLSRTAARNSKPSCPISAGSYWIAMSVGPPWSTARARDYASAYGISDIPANVLIGREGAVVQIDLSRRNLESVVSRMLGH